jgi:cellulose biosynthesis protein BcsQ
MSGSIVTFYSFKGGVGRSFALANIAVILAQWGARVLTVDWDVEAPGLNHYFVDLTPKLNAGVQDFLDDCRRGNPRTWRTYAFPVVLGDGNSGLYIMPAAAGGGIDYTERVQHLDWDILYEKHGFGHQLEKLRAEWVENFDFVLVDSRTGVTDFSGLTTAQLPDTLAFLFTANSQSLQGCADIARRAMEARRSMPLDRPALLPLPIPARFEQREEYERARAWRDRFATVLTPFLENWMPQGTDTLKLIDLLTIPYVPRWTFGEELAVLVEAASQGGTRTSGQAISFAMETIAALLVNGFGKIDLLLSSRDEYVHAARAAIQDWRATGRDMRKVFICYSAKEGEAVAKIANALRGANLLPWVANAELPAGQLEIMEAVETSDAYIVVVGPSFGNSKWVQAEVEAILRHSLRSDVRKPIIPIVLPGGDRALKASRLGNFAATFLKTDEAFDSQLSPVIERLIESTPMSPQLSL